ncbi:MAG: hypothetical protein QM754_09170 [Tepidisphaeraceae bacterium]
MIEVSYLPPPINPDSDYSGRFIAAGVILLLIAVMAGCLTALMPVGYVIQQQNYATYQQMIAQQPAAVHVTYRYPQPQPIQNFIYGIVLYGAVMVSCAWLGIGAFLKRRYVRPLVMIFSWQAIVVLVLAGISALIGLFIIVSDPALNHYTVNPYVIIASTMVGLAIMIALPTALYLLMKNDGVRTTAEFFDLKARWTDRMPLPVLGFFLTLVVFTGFECLMLAKPSLPLIMTYATGLPAAAILFLHIAVMGLASYWIYSGDHRGWTLGFWAMIVPLVIFSISTVTLPTEAYTRLVTEQSPEGVRLVENHELAMRVSWLIICLLLIVTTVIYFRSVRRSLPQAALPVIPLQ